MTWNDERVDVLKKLWADGLSASQIAGRLGGVTRNAVIGKVHRLGLVGPRHHLAHEVAPAARARAGRQAPDEAAPAPTSATRRFRNLYLGDSEPYVPPAEELVIPMGERKYIQTLTESCCRWPIGDPQQPEFHFCGKKKIPGLPYCEVHARRAFQPPQARRRDRDFVPMIAVANGASRGEPGAAGAGPAQREGRGLTRPPPRRG